MKKIAVVLLILSVSMSALFAGTEHTSVAGKDGEIIDIMSVYDSKENLTYKKLLYIKGNRSEEYKFDSDGRRIYRKRLNADGSSSEKRYAPDGSVIYKKRTDCTGNSAEYKYDSAGNEVYYREVPGNNPNGWKEEKYGYNSAGIRVSRKVNFGDGSWAEYEYDTNGTTVRTIEVLSDGSKSEHKYNSAGNELYNKEVRVDGWKEVQYEYVSDGKLSYSKVSLSDGSWTELKVEFDSGWNVTGSEELKYSDGTLTKTRYNSDGKVIYEKVSSSGRKTEYTIGGNFSYNNKNRPSDGWTNLKAEYDSAGNVTGYEEIKYSDGKLTKTKYDSDGRVVYKKR